MNDNIMSAITALLKKDPVGKFRSNTVLAYPTIVLIQEMMLCIISTIQFTDIAHSFLEHKDTGKITTREKILRTKVVIPRKALGVAPHFSLSVYLEKLMN